MTATVNAITRYPDGTIWPYARVEIGIYGYGLGADGSVVSGVTPKLSNSDGTISFSLPANNPGELYSWINEDGTQVAFGPVPASGSFTLQSLATPALPSYQSLAGFIRTVVNGSARPAGAATVLFTGGTSATPPAAAVSGDLWTYPS